MEIFDFILHIDEYLANIIAFFGSWTYVILFGIVFAETGFVVLPFLPGDSLLFTVGTFAGAGFINFVIAYFAMLAAAILGDTVNYWCGYHIGPKVFRKDNSRLFNKAYIEKTQQFYHIHGGRTIIIARFLPIVRTFAPFVAGIGKMKYSTFFLYNIVGAVIWVTSLMVTGYFLGGIPIIKENLEYVVIGIVVLSFMPVFSQYFSYKKRSRSAIEKIHE